MNKLRARDWIGIHYNLIRNKNRRIILLPLNIIYACDDCKTQWPYTKKKKIVLKIVLGWGINCGEFILIIM